jgi:crotonobetainyl-CoA:carnitine CoA-transferase CaiB-like acyl-CoA transferase
MNEGDNASGEPLPLQGVLVVALEQAIAAPFATRQLADLGARVIKIERPGEGDFARDYDRRVRGLASHFVWCNRSKESVCLDLKTDEGRRALRGLIARADVLIQNLAPGAIERMGFDAQRLVEEFPRLIVCGISGYGAYGPHRNRKAYDLLIQSEAGLLSVTGDKRAMAKVGVSIADIAAGMYAYSGILTALLRRQQTQKGAILDISMLEALGEWMGFPMYYAFEGQPAPPRAGASHATIYPYGPFRAGPERSVMLGLQNEREWAAFCADVLETPQLASDPRFSSNVGRSDNREALTAIIEAAFDKLGAEAVVARLDAAGVANANVNTMADFWSHPQLKARNRWREVATAAGPIPALVPSGLPVGLEPRMDPVPELGAHTEAVLREFGLAP